MAHAHPHSMLQTTLQTLSQQDAVFATGPDLLKDWMSALKSVPKAEPLVKHLGDLYDELANPHPAVDRVKQLLNTIAGHTQALGRELGSTTADELTQLADSLRSFATDLGGEPDDQPENQPGNAPVYDLQNSGDRVQMMFNQTLSVLAGGVAATTPESGATMVEDWITAVRSDHNTEWVQIPLTQLRDALNAGDMRATEQAMRELAGLAQDYANNYEGQFSKDLTYLATALISFAQPLH